MKIMTIHVNKRSLQVQACLQKFQGSGIMTLDRPAFHAGLKL